MSKIIQSNIAGSHDVLAYYFENDEYIDQDIDIDLLRQKIDFNFTTPSYKIYVLYPDENINYEIPNECIKTGGSYNENYQNGQRRTLSFTLYNEEGKYLPTINTLWIGTRLRLDVGVQYLNTTVWFVKGIFVINKISPTLGVEGKEVSISANDKFSLFESGLGKLESSYTVEEGNEIEEVIKTILKTDLGNGSIFDPQPLIYDPVFKGKKVQVDISKSAGETYGSILMDLATQLSAEIFYNSYGNLTFCQITEVGKDADKPLIYDFDADEGGLSQLNYDYDYETAVNRIVVLGSSQDGNVYQAIAVNRDEGSPFCYQRIGYRTGEIINDSNIYSDILAEERAEYELRQKLILKTTSTSEVLFNPFLTVNNLIGITSSFYNLRHARFLLQSISFSLDFSGKMSMTFTNINNLKTNLEIVRVNYKAPVSYPVYFYYDADYETD